MDDHFRSGIYLIVNLVDGKIYIGSGKCVIARKWGHFSLLRNGRHNNPHLQRAYKKYGEESFVFEVVEYCSEEDLLIREDWWMALLNSMDRKKGYNLRTARRQIPSEETRLRVAKARVGKKLSQETKAKISLAHKGKVLSEEHKAKIGVNAVKIHTGKKRSDETKRRISEAHKGKPLSAEHLESLKRRPRPSEETLIKLSEAHKGKPWSEARRNAQNERKKRLSC